MSQSRLFVFQLKQIIIVGILVILGIILSIITIKTLVSRTGYDSSDDVSARYKPGIYTSNLSLNNLALNVEVTVDSNCVKSIEINQLTDTVTTMYPLIEPSLDAINSQLSNNIDIGSIKLNDDCKYTQTLIIDAAEVALDKACLP